MSLLVGLSVIIPYVGAIAVTIPVAIIAWFQWGATSDFVYLMVAYLVVQFMDGNILVPLLFSEVVNMHPAAAVDSNSGSLKTFLYRRDAETQRLF
jgi:putative permease